MNLRLNGSKPRRLQSADNSSEYRKSLDFLVGYLICFLFDASHLEYLKLNPGPRNGSYISIKSDVHVTSTKVVYLEPRLILLCVPMNQRHQLISRNSFRTHVFCSEHRYNLIVPKNVQRIDKN